MKMRDGARTVAEELRTSVHAVTNLLRFGRTTEANNGLAAFQAMPGLVSPKLQPVRVQEKNRARGGRHRAYGLHEAAALYEAAIGEAPHEVKQAGGAVLIETGVAGSYEDYPNGYVPILMSPTANGWVVFDTGQTATKLDFEPDAVLRDANVLYVETGKDPDQVRRGIRTLVGTLRDLHQGW